MCKMQIVFANRKMQEVSKLLRKFDKADKKQEIEFDAEIAHKIKIVKFGLKNGYNTNCIIVLGVVVFLLIYNK